MTVPASRSSASTRLEAYTARILLTIAPPPASGPAGESVLVLTIGLPGSGKSTFARRLAPLIDAVILESDALRRLLFGTPAYSAIENRRLFAALHAAARSLLSQGRSVIIDATSLKESDRRPVYDLAAETGVRLLQLRFSAPPAVIEQRLARRAAAADPVDSSSAGPSVYRRMQALAELPRREHLNIETSNAAETESALSRVVEACRPAAGRILGGIH